MQNNQNKIFSMALFIFALLQINFTTAQASLTQEQRLSDYHQLVASVERNYAALKWKKEFKKFDWNAHITKYEDLIAKASSDKKFYQVLAQFLSGFEDAHIWAEIPSSYRATLGFACDYIEGKVLIETIDQLKLPAALFPFKKGDQLISIGGVPVETLMQQLNIVSNTGYDVTQKHFLAASLTSRSEAIGYDIPQGLTSVTILRQGEAKPITVIAAWAAQGRPVVELDDLIDTLKMNISFKNNFLSDTDSKPSSLANFPLLQAAIPNQLVQEWKNTGVKAIGSRTSMFTLPDGAQTIPDLSITAATFTAEGKKIGVVRIPNFSDDSAMAEVTQAIQYMEANSDVLVIDETNNPGGAVPYASYVASLLIKETAKDMLFDLRPSLAWLTSIDSELDEIDKILKSDPTNMEANALQARFQYLDSELRNGLTQKKFLLGTPFSLNLNGEMGTIQPHPLVHYTKPVLLLTNELDFSAADMFPAILKDNGRVTLFGARTAGAGGNVAEFGPLAHSHFKYTLTQSLMVRPNGQYVENLGVSPDIEYTVTTDDFMNGYRGYVTAFTKAALGLLK